MAKDHRLDGGIAEAWPVGLALHDLGRGTVERRLIAEGPTLTRIAQILELTKLKSLEARLRITPWLDGAQIEGLWTASIVQICGISLEPFETALGGEFSLRAVPSGSSALPVQSDHEIELDPEADDPPDEITDGVLPLGAYVVEDLSLAIDPFPRKPGVDFQPPPEPSEPSPFAALARLKNPDA